MRTNEIHLPSGEKFGSVSQPHSSPATGFLVTRRWAVPFERINQMPFALMSDSYAIHLPSGEKEGCPRSPVGVRLRMTLPEGDKSVIPPPRLNSASATIFLPFGDQSGFNALTTWVICFTPDPSGRIVKSW
jgi:hypothetical protein